MTPAAFDLSGDDLRVVARYVATAAEALLPFYTDIHPDDPRPRDAVAAAWHFAGGAPRTALQRTASMDAHRAAASAADEAARLAAQAAGDAASAAYLHPIAKAHQVGHILRADANAARIAEITAGSDPAAAHDAIAGSADRATPELREILRRYPPAPAGRSRTAELLEILDDALRVTP